MLQFGQVILFLFLSVSWLVVAFLLVFGWVGIWVVGCVVVWFFCSVLLFSGVLVVFWLLVEVVSIIDASFGVLIGRISGFLGVSGIAVFRFLIRLMVKAIMVKVIAIVTAA